MASTPEPRIVKKAGEGYDKPEQELPIDINYQKLAEWLVSRRELSSTCLAVAAVGETA
jgi:hypothetical protein